MWSRTSTSRRPVASAMYASLTVHSSLIVQSCTCVPEGTPTCVTGTVSARTARVSRTPAPVMLRRTG